MKHPHLPPLLNHTSVLNLSIQNVFFEIYGQSALRAIWKVFYLVKVQNHLITRMKCPKNPYGQSAFCSTLNTTLRSIRYQSFIGPNLNSDYRRYLDDKMRYTLAPFCYLYLCSLQYKTHIFQNNFLHKFYL